MRLFVAFDFPDQIRQGISEAISQLEPKSRGVRWMRPEGMHVTLKFIGETAAGSGPAIRGALAWVHSPRAIEINFRGIGFFPNDRRPRVVWCGVEGSPSLAKLNASVEEALEPFGIGRESRPFAPHLTLARLNSRQQAGDLVRAAADWKSHDFGSTREAEFHLFQSFLKPSGAEYKRLATFAFVKGAP
ncbi:MAG: RNA 2',3'-cyclic phosphodiesterase [Candidatus Acidiferrales bacterium]